MKGLEYTKQITVRFSETDPLGIVWHGNYIKYFEDGREAFGKEYGIGYWDFFHQGVVVPVIHCECNYKRSLKFDEAVDIHTIYEPCEAAKIIFRYNLYLANTNVLITTGSTTQVFMEKDSQLLIPTNPPFFQEWKIKYGLV